MGSSAAKRVRKPGIGNFDTGRYYNEEQISELRVLFARINSRDFDQLAAVRSRRYSIDELKAIGEDGLWDQGRWVSWNDTLAIGGLGPAANSILNDKKAEKETLMIGPSTPIIRPLDDLSNTESAGASNEDRIWLSPPAMLETERANDNTPVISFSDDEDIYSAGDRESRTESCEFISPTISFETKQVENQAPQNSVTANSPSRNEERALPPTDSGIECLESVPGPESDIESWVNEPTVAEIEEKLRNESKLVENLNDTLQETIWQYDSIKFRYESQLREKTELTDRLLYKLQVAEAELKGPQLKYAQELPTEKIHALIESNNTLTSSLEKLYNESLASVKAVYDRRLLAAEEIRLAGLAEVEKMILKCDTDWKAEREILIAKLEASEKQKGEWKVKGDLLGARLEALKKSDEKISQHARIASEGYKKLSMQAAKAQAQLKGLAEEDDSSITGLSNKEPESLTINEITKIFEELRTKLYESMNMGSAQKKSVSAQHIHRKTATIASQTGNGSDSKVARRVRVDASMHSKVEATLNVARSGTENSSKTCSYKAQSKSRIPLSARGLNSRLLKAANDNRDLQLRLKSISEKHETLIAQNEVLLRDNTILQEHAWKVALKSAEIPFCREEAQEDADIEVPVQVLKAEVRYLRQQIVDITRERKFDNEMHEKLRGHYFALNAKYQQVLSQPHVLDQTQSGFCDTTNGFLAVESAERVQ